MPGIRSRGALGGAALVLAACEPALPASTSPGCTAILTDVSLTSEDRRPEAAVVLVIDGSISTRLGDPRSEALRRSLADTIAMLLDGDWDRDGRPDFSPLTVLRLAVVGVDGAVIEAPAPELPSSLGDPRATELDGGLELWPGDPGWDAWFLEAVLARLDAALEAPRPARVAAVTAIHEFAVAHPDFVPRWVDPAIVVVTDRDLDDDPTAELPLAYRRGSLSITAAIPEVLLPPRGASPDFPPLLGEQPFDDSAPRCADGTVLGRYPRGLLRVGADASAQGAFVELSSLCMPRISEVAITGWRTGPMVGVCLPAPLPIGPDHLVGCAMTVTLPPAGAVTGCEQLGLRLSDLVRTDTGEVRERCAVPQLLLAELTPPGFYYDDFDPFLPGACGSEARLALTSRLAYLLPFGARIEARCESGSTACGFSHPSAADAGPIDAR